MRLLLPLLSGILFGIGLTLSGMIDPMVVLGFLDLAGQWNPALIFVMASAIPVTLVGYRLVLKRRQPLFDSEFHLPTNPMIDRPLLMGAAIFGIGWGLIGLCPGPAIASISSGQPKVFLFLLSMMVGMLAMDKMAARK